MNALRTGDRLRAVDRTVAQRTQDRQELEDLRVRIRGLQADQEQLEHLRSLDRDGRFIQADGLVELGVDARFEPAVIANKDRRHTSWWRVSGAILGAGAALAAAASAIPGVAPWVAGLIGGIAVFGAIVGPSNLRSFEDTHLRPRRVDRILTGILERELAADAVALKEAGERAARLEARLARPDEEILQEELRQSEAPRTIEEREASVDIDGVELPRGRSAP